MYRLRGSYSETHLAVVLQGALRLLSERLGAVQERLSCTFHENRLPVLGDEGVLLVGVVICHVGPVGLEPTGATRLQRALGCQPTTPLLGMALAVYRD
jgi:hypothetical protein